MRPELSQTRNSGSYPPTEDERGSDPVPRQVLRDGDTQADHELTHRMLAGEEAAFETFFEGSFPPLYRFSLSRLRNGDLAREVAQTAICNAITNLRKYRGDAPLSAWLFTICRNEISAHFRRRSRRPEPVELLEESPAIRQAMEALTTGSDGPDRALHRKELAAQIHGILDALPPRYGQVLEWKYIEGLSVREMASRLELGPKAAESLLTRARVAFKEAFLSMTGSDAEQPATQAISWSAALLALAVALAAEAGPWTWDLERNPNLDREQSASERRLSP